jgi:hypothetical protein
MNARAGERKESQSLWEADVCGGVEQAITERGKAPFDLDALSGREAECRMATALPSTSCRVPRQRRCARWIVQFTLNESFTSEPT